MLTKFDLQIARLKKELYVMERHYRESVAPLRVALNKAYVYAGRARNDVSQALGEAEARECINIRAELAELETLGKKARKRPPVNSRIITYVLPNDPTPRACNKSSLPADAIITGKVKRWATDSQGNPAVEAPRTNSTPAPITPTMTPEERAAAFARAMADDPAWNDPEMQKILATRGNLSDPAQLPTEVTPLHPDKTPTTTADTNEGGWDEFNSLIGSLTPK